MYVRDEKLTGCTAVRAERGIKEDDRDLRPKNSSWRQTYIVSQDNLAQKFQGKCKFKMEY